MSRDIDRHKQVYGAKVYRETELVQLQLCQTASSLLLHHRHGYRSRASPYLPHHPGGSVVGVRRLCLLLLDDDHVALSILLLFVLLIFLLYCRSRNDGSGGSRCGCGSSERPANLITLANTSIRTQPFSKAVERTYRPRSGYTRQR